MAKLDVRSYTPTPVTLPGIAADMNYLLGVVKKGLQELTGSPMTPDGRFVNPPRNLDTRRFAIRKDYADIRSKTSIVFDFNTYGATATHSTNVIRLGEFFLSTNREYEHVRNVLAH